MLCMIIKLYLSIYLFIWVFDLLLIDQCPLLEAGDPNNSPHPINKYRYCTIQLAYNQPYRIIVLWSSIARWLWCYLHGFDRDVRQFCAHNNAQPPIMLTVSSQLQTRAKKKRLLNQRNLRSTKRSPNPRSAFSSFLPHIFPKKFGAIFLGPRASSA